MNNQQLERLIKVSRKTGSPVIILDESGEETVLLPLSTYESLLDEGMYGFEEDELFENQQIDVAPIIDIEDIDHGLYQESEPEISNKQTGLQEFGAQEDHQNIGSNNLEAENKDLDSVLNEEQFYLEPIE